MKWFDWAKTNNRSEYPSHAELDFIEREIRKTHGTIVDSGMWLLLCAVGTLLWALLVCGLANR